MAPLKRLVAALPLLSSLLLADGARAQLPDNTTITLKDPIERRNDFDAGRDRKSINREDCNENESIGLNLVMGEPDAQLEIWASTSTDCSQDDLRNSSDSLCWQVLQAEPNSEVFDVRVRDILPHSGARAGGPGSGTESSCNQATGGSVTLYIMLISGTTNLNADSAVTVVFNHDLAGPKAATLRRADSAEGGLILKWDTSSSNDVLGYYLYCEVQDESTPAPTTTGGSTGSSGGAATGGSTGSSGTAGTSGGGTAGAAGVSGIGGGAAGAGTMGVAGTAGAEGVSGEGGTAGTTTTGGTAGTEAMAGVGGLNAQQQETDLGDGGSTAGTAGTAGSTGTSGTTSVTEDPECRAQHLKAGLAPGDAEREFRRATASQISREAFAGGLENNKSYACGVAAYDEEDNLGALSNLKCGTPQYVRDYFEEYRAAGGLAGGGYCRFGRASAGSLGLTFGFAALGLGLALRRRSRRSAQ